MEVEASAVVHSTLEWPKRPDIVETIGSGTYGQIYKAVTGDGDIVVVKELAASDAGTFNLEVDNLRSLTGSKYVVPLLGLVSSQRCIILPYYPLGDMTNFLRRPEKLLKADARRLLRSTCNGLSL